MSRPSVKQLFEVWSNNAKEDSDLIKELQNMSDNDNEIYECFYKDLEFGTAGLRGIIGAGTNRLNIYTVARATQGLADYLNSRYASSCVAISFDSRIKSDLFARTAASVLAANGIKAFISAELQPTPVVSFTVRELHCQAGIMITASHNPAKYNGYKCYGSDGCQMTDLVASSVYDHILTVDTFNIKKISFQEGLQKKLIEYIPDTVYEGYIKSVKRQQVNAGICKSANLKVVYSPLNGTGNKLVRKILEQTGVNNLSVVPEQELPDGNFPTCPYPNPEFKEALDLALQLGQKLKADLVLATDPDSDRVGIAIRTEDTYRLLSGNETGVLLLYYILSCRFKDSSLPSNPVVVKTLVTTPLVGKICESFNCTLKNVLPGFKYIGDQILRLERNGQEDCFVFGFEESYGYLAGTYVRDKDAVVASMLICEMMAYYKSKGKNLTQVIKEIYQKYGFYKSTTLSFTFEGSNGVQKINHIMNSLRESPLKNIADIPVTSIADYELLKIRNISNGFTCNIDLPKSNILEFSLKDCSKIIVRPSGTEPKIKVYINTTADSQSQADKINQQLSKFISDMINNKYN